MLRILRIVASHSCIACCVALAVLGIRSDSANDILLWADSNNQMSWALNSVQHRILFLWSDELYTLHKPGITLSSGGFYDSLDAEMDAFPLIDWEISTTDQGYIGIAHWIGVFLSALLALLLKPQTRFRVSLREVFVLTTLAGVTIGGITAVFRLAV